MSNELLQLKMKRRHNPIKNGLKIWTDIFIQKILTEAKSHMKRCSTSLIWYPHTPVRMTITKKKKYWQECGEKGTLGHCGWGCKLVQSQQKIIYRFLNKLKRKLRFNPVIPVLSIHPKKVKTLFWKDYIYSPVFTAALSTIAKISQIMLLIQCCLSVTSQ